MAGIMVAMVANAGQLVIYTDRAESLLKPALTEFENNTGHNIKVYYGGDSLLERLKNEGKNSPADVVISTNSLLSDYIFGLGLTESLPDKIITKANPEYIDDNKSWVGLNYRARLVVMPQNTNLPKPENFLDLAKDIYKGKICLRDGTHRYNVDLFSQMKLQNPNEFSQFLLKLKQNLVRKPVGSDRDQVKLVLSGGCELAVVNNYYLGLLSIDMPDIWQKISVVFPVISPKGSPIAISAFSILKNSGQKPIAEELAQFLLSPIIQEKWARDNFELPVTPILNTPKELQIIKPKIIDNKLIHLISKEREAVLQELLISKFNE